MTRKVSKFKTDTFNKCVSIVCDRFNIEPETFFSKTKEQETVDARHLVYLACYYKGFAHTTTTILMVNNGYVTGRSTIYAGITSMEKKVEIDKQYKRILRKLC